MKTYIISILTVSVISGIICSFLPHKNGGLKKHLNFIVGLICAIILISPIVKIAKNTVFLKEGIDSILESMNISSSIKDSNQVIIDTSIEKIENGIKSTVISKFKLKDSDVYVSLAVDKSDIEAIEITKIIITLQNEASWYSDDKIKDFVEELTECPVEIIKK